ncbi:MAG: hypothetical protein AAF433_21110, partial [Bacteroidota bacterium]
EDLTKSIAVLKERYPGVNSTDFNHHVAFLEVVLAMQKADYVKVKEVCLKQIALLESEKFYPRPYVRSFLLQLISVSISTEDFYSGEIAIKKFLSLIPVGSRAWFRTQQLYTQLAITTDQYSLSANLIRKVIEHKNYKGLAEAVKERIILLKAYVFWLGAIGKIADRGENFKSFRLAKFLNSVPDFAKDRQGLNIPVLIAQALWLLHRKKFEKVRERLNALKRYSDRYLKNNKGTVRTYYFLKAFCQLADSNFHRNGFLRKSEKNLKLLNQHPRSKDEQNVEVEIIPYERLYDLVVEQLDLRLH